MLATLDRADGNVLAYVDSAGELWVIGDDASNDVRIDSGGDDQSTFDAAGRDATTTVNGQAYATHFAPGENASLETLVNQPDRANAGSPTPPGFPCSGPGSPGRGGRRRRGT